MGGIIKEGGIKILNICQQTLGFDIIGILDVGAYGFSMSSNYNSRPRAAEVLVDGKTARLVTKRENYADLIRKEIVR